MRWGGGRYFVEKMKIFFAFRKFRDFEFISLVWSKIIKDSDGFEKNDRDMQIIFFLIEK